MKYTVNKKISIAWKLNSTGYKKINKELVNMYPERIGSSTRANSIILDRRDELKQIMQSELKVNNNHPDWDGLLANYFYNIEILIPNGQKDFEIGFSYNIDDSSRKEFISDLKSKNKDITTSEDLAKFVENPKNGIESEDKYKYGYPINVKDYVHYIYILGHSHVANSIDDVNKSNKIRFYLYSQETVNAAKKERAKFTNEAMKVYLEVLKDNDSKLNVLSILHDSDISLIDKDEYDIELFKLFELDKSKFVEVANDKTLKDKAFIERCIKTKLLKRIADTGTIVDTNDPNKILGGDINEAITYLNSSKQEVYRNELKIKLKNINNKK